MLRYLECRKGQLGLLWGMVTESCRNLFKELNILPLMSQYILSLLTFVSNNKEQYFAYCKIHNINTRHTSDLHLPRTHLNIYQKVFYYSGIKIFIVFHRISKHTLIIQEHLKRQLKIFIHKLLLLTTIVLY
jgi:hypothetical protein